MNCLPQKPPTNGCQIILTDPAIVKIVLNIKPFQCAENSISNRGILARKKLVSLRIRAAYLIIRNNLIWHNADEREQQ